MTRTRPGLVSRAVDWYLWLVAVRLPYLLVGRRAARRSRLEMDRRWRG